MGSRDNPLPWWTIVFVMLITITVLHYATCSGHEAFHTIYRRLYYLPIVLAAFLGGISGGLWVAALTTLLYLPHAFFLAEHRDPGPVVDKLLEIIHYFGVGGFAGLLVARERRARRREARAAVAEASAVSTARRLGSLVHLSRGLAHEIRNPLGGIQGAMEILADDVPPDHPKREMVDVALKETARLDGVLGDFLEFARPREPERQQFAVSALLAHVVALLKPEAEKRSIVLETTCRTPTMAYGDPQQITQVLVNLVQNSLAVTPAGGRVTVFSEAPPRDGGESPAFVRFVVADTGPGVPPELEQSIYDPYVSEREGGTGLGLCLSALIVEQNGGILSHENAPTGGAVFTFTLPTGKGPSEVDGVAPEKGKAS